MYVFVYGTLKSGFGNNRVLKNSKFIKNTKVNGFKLCSAGFFPVAVPSENNTCLGEVYEVVEDNIMKSLDFLESEGTMYLRTEVSDINNEKMEMYVGNSEFWNDFKNLKECPTTKEGVYYWGKC